MERKNEIKKIFNPDDLRGNWLEFEKILCSNRIKKLYHFTDTSNLVSIKNHGGLFSRYYCKKHEIPHKCGGNFVSHRLDDKAGLSDYIRLSFNDKLPMLYILRNSGRDLATLEIDPKVIFLKSTLFSDKNATDRNAIVGDKINHFEIIKFNIATTRWQNDEEKHYYQAEVLVKTHIPLILILNRKKWL